MNVPIFFHSRRFALPLTAGLAAAFLIALQPPVTGQQAHNKLVRIGSTGTLASGHTPAQETAATASLKQFIKDETGYNDEITLEKGWRPVADQLAKGKLDLGAFQGYEFAWAKQKYPQLKALALAVNGDTYPAVYVVVRKDSPVKDFAALQGKTLEELGQGKGALTRMYVERQCQAQGKAPGAFFSKVDTKNNIEDIIDDVIDGTVQAGAVPKVGLEAYKQRKPGRFAQLRPIGHSGRVIPGVLAYYDNRLDQTTLTNFRNGLVNANKKEKGQVLLTIYHLTGFVNVPGDFPQVMAETLKQFPPENGSK